MENRLYQALEIKKEYQMRNTVLITGTSSGIGLKTALHFSQRGWNVVATLRKPEQAPEALKAPGILITRLDVLDEASIQSAIKEGITHFGKIDVLVNNAGFGVMGAFEPTPVANIKRQFDTNVFGLMSVVKGILPHFRENKSGVIINISSVGGRTTFPLFSLYHSTKFAVEGFTESLQYELENMGIRVKLVEPGAVLTDFGGRSLDRVDLKDGDSYAEYTQTLTKKIEKAAENGQTPEEVAAVIFQAATDGSKRMRYVSGGQAKVLIFLKRVLPERAFRSFMKMNLRVL